MENMTKDQAATRKAIKDCAEWLKFCLSIGWQKEQLDGLQKIWWEHHDEKGNLTASGSVAAPKEELWEKLSSIRDKYFLEEFHPSYWKAKEGFENESQIIGDALDAIDELASLRQQLKEREEELQALKNGIRKGSELYANLKFDDEPTGYQIALKKIQEREEALKELLPIAQRGYDLLVPFDKKGMGKEWPAIIEKARNLISK